MGIYGRQNDKSIDIMMKHYYFLFDISYVILCTIQTRWTNILILYDTITIYLPCTKDVQVQLQ